MRFLIILAVAAACSAHHHEHDASPCTEGPEVGMENDSVFKQCDSTLRNWLKSNWHLNEDQVKAVGAKKVGDNMGSQFLVQMSPEVCMVAPVSNTPRGPPALGTACKLEGPCPIPSMYNKC